MKNKKSVNILIVLMLLFLSQAGYGQDQKQTANATDDNFISGLSFKFGWMTKPKAEALGDKWIAAVSWDKPIGPYLAWGLECQPYLRGFKGEDFEISFIVGNLFLNAKAGYPVGQLIKIEALKFLTPLNVYGGLGAGVELSNASVTEEAVSYSDFKVRLAWHMVFGIEYSLRKIGIMMELQPVRVIDKNLDPGTIKTGYLFFGIRLYP